MPPDRGGDPVEAGTRAASRLAFIALELLFLVTAHLLGGPPWVVLGGITVVLHAFAGLRAASLAMLLPSVAWLGWFHATGNRELFFPYAMGLAMSAAVCGLVRHRWPPAAGGIIVAAFLAVRILQQATCRVLAVETAVAAVILAMGIIAARLAPRGIASKTAIVAAASLAAYAGLAL